MAEKRKPLPKFNTPVGIARYPHLTKADTRFDDDGVYKCDIILPGDDEEVQELIKYLEKIRNAKFKESDGKKKVKAPVYEDELDDAGDETGNVIFKTKLNAIGRNKKTGEEWANSPKLFDSQGNPLPSGVNPWSGTKLIIAGTVNAYAMTQKGLVDGKQKKFTSVGVSLKCKGVQILELVTGGDADAESFGFGKQDGGYETEAAQAGLGESSGAEDADDSDGEDEDEF